MKSGDRIKWGVKYGKYIGQIRHTVKYKGRHQLAMVQFDGNKRVSRVPHCELELIEEEDENNT